MNSMIMDTQKKRTQKLESPEMTAAMTAVNTLVDYAAILAKNGSLQPSSSACFSTGVYTEFGVAPLPI